MINFRFHIISLTAVFLAFAVGLVLGTTFLDDATERELRRQLDGLENDLGSARHNNSRLHSQLDRFDEEGQALDEQLGQRLLPGMLVDIPVLVIAPEGLDGEPVERVVEALAQSGANYLGTWQLTDRLALDDGDEVGDLAAALEVPSTDDVDRLHTNLSGKLATTLFLAIHSSDVDVDASDVVDPGSASPAEPATIAALHEQGFIDYQVPDGSESDVVQLPSAGLRVVVVSGPGATVPREAVLLPTLTDLVSDGAAPVVVTATTPTDEDDPANVDGVDALVAAVRDGDDLSERISTVDDLELVSGRLAAMLALQAADPDEPEIGQYGLGSGAQELMPAVPGTGDS
jgi:hypothetical protein